MNLGLKHAPKDLLVKVRSQLFLECGEVGRVGDYWEGMGHCQHDLEMNLYSGLSSISFFLPSH